MEKRTLYAIFMVFVAIMFAGQILSYAVDPYHHEASSWDNGDGTIGYRVSSSTSSEYGAVMIDTGSVVMPDKLLVYYDTSFISHVGGEYVGKVLRVIASELRLAGIDFELVSAERLLDRIQSDLTAGTPSFRVLIPSGAMPNIIYAGSAESPIMKWLEQGGALYWTGGPIGRHISEPVGLSECTGYGNLFFGIADSDISTGLNGRAYGEQKSLNFDEFKSLNILFNDCTYGIKTGAMANYLSIGYTADEGDSLVLAKYNGGSGMIVDFGGKLATNTAPTIAKVIASKITYDSSVVYEGTGRLQGNAVSGSIPADPAKTYILYVWIGYPIQIFSRTFGYY